MTTANYPNCLNITLRWEGGNSDNKNDPGGRTRKGVIQRTYDSWRKARGLPVRSVFQMTDDEMRAIYKANYWDAVKGDTLAVGVDLATWDYGVNSGPARARKALLSVVGGSDKQTVQKLCAQRLGFLKGLKTWVHFGKGWANRVADIEARAVKMVLQASEATQGAVQSALVQEASRASKTADNQVKTAKTSGAAATVSGSASATAMATNVDPHFWASLALGAVFVLLVGVLVYAVVKTQQNKTRADAYLRVAKED